MSQFIYTTQSGFIINTFKRETILSLELNYCPFENTKKHQSMFPLARPGEY